MLSVRNLAKHRRPQSIADGEIKEGSRDGRQLAPTTVPAGLSPGTRSQSQFQQTGKNRKHYTCYASGAPLPAWQIPPPTWDKCARRAPPTTTRPNGQPMCFTFHSKAGQCDGYACHRSHRCPNPLPSGNYCFGNHSKELRPRNQPLVEGMGIVTCSAAVKEKLAWDGDLVFDMRQFRDPGTTWQLKNTTGATPSSWNGW